MCHITRLTATQQRTFEGMPEPYQRAMLDAIEQTPPGREYVRPMFDAWVARLEGIDNARRVDEVTREVIVEANQGEFFTARTR